MVKIRLRRVGAKKQPHYRVVVAEARSPRGGKFLETIGNYNPRTEPPTVEIDGERALYWLTVGAQPTEAVRRMLDKLGILARAAAIKRGEVLAEVKAQVAPVVAGEPEALEMEPWLEVARKREVLEEEAFLAEVEEEAGEEEDDEFELGEDLYEEDEELDELDDWEPEVSDAEESDDLEDDWDLDVEEDDDVDDDLPFEEDDE